MSSGKKRVVWVVLCARWSFAFEWLIFIAKVHGMSDVACESLVFESMTWCWKDVWSSSVWRCFMMNDTHLNLWLGWIFDSIFIWRWSLLWFELIFGTKVHLVGNIGTKWGNVFIICTWTWINGSSVRMGLLFNMSSS